MKIPITDKSLPKAIVPVVRKAKQAVSLARKQQKTTVEDPERSQQKADTEQPSSKLDEALLRLRRFGGLALLIVIVAVASIAGYIAFSNRDNPLPDEIANTIPFSPLVVSAGSEQFSTSDYKLATAEDGVEILSFNVQTPQGTTVSVSEYPQPPQFSEIEQYQQRFLDNVVKKYDTVQSANGVVHLGRLTTEEHEQQVGVMIERGLLVFMNPEQELEPQQWRELADSLSLQR